MASVEPTESPVTTLPSTSVTSLCSPPSVPRSCRVAARVSDSTVTAAADATFDAAVGAAALRSVACAAPAAGSARVARPIVAAAARRRPLVPFAVRAGDASCEAATGRWRISAHGRSRE